VRHPSDAHGLYDTKRLGTAKAPLCWLILAPKAAQFYHLTGRTRPHSLGRSGAMAAAKSERTDRLTHRAARRQHAEQVLDAKPRAIAPYQRVHPIL
jgi:hypothetical protein